MVWQGGGGQEAVSRCRGDVQEVLNWRYGGLGIPKPSKTKGNTVKTTPKSQKFACGELYIRIDVRNH